MHRWRKGKIKARGIGHYSGLQSGNYLDTCLDSVGRQTYGDFEAIVVDDGSTDGSQAVALRHAERDARIVVISTVNQGAARARETGIRHAKGDYICFLDGDDVWDSRMLEKLVAAIGENGGYDIVCCDYKRICKTYEAPRREMRTSDMQGLDFLVASLYHAISVTVWGRLYRRALFERSCAIIRCGWGKTACSTSRSAASSRASGLSTTWATGMCSAAVGQPFAARYRLLR